MRDLEPQKRQRLVAGKSGEVRVFHMVAAVIQTTYVRSDPSSSEHQITLRSDWESEGAWSSVEFVMQINRRGTARVRIVGR